MSKDAEKAVAACIAYAKAQAEVRRLSNEIGDALSACHSAYVAKHPDDWTAPMWESHLKQAYAYEEIEETQYTGGRRDYLTSEEQAEVLAECPHCLAAHKAIQQRKTARKTFGAAKRYIGGIGRRAATSQAKEST